jgi:hypothetical protein
MGTIPTLTLILALLGILERVASNLQGNSEMWEIVKKFLALILSFKEYFTKEKEKEVVKLQEQEAKAHAEVQVEYEKAKETLEAAGWSGDAFESELDKLRDKQQH